MILRIVFLALLVLCHAKAGDVTIDFVRMRDVAKVSVARGMDALTVEETIQFGPNRYFHDSNASDHGPNSVIVHLPLLHVAAVDSGGPALTAEPSVTVTQGVCRRIVKIPDNRQPRLLLDVELQSPRPTEFVVTCRYSVPVKWTNQTLNLEWVPQFENEEFMPPILFQDLAYRITVASDRRYSVSAGANSGVFSTQTDTVIPILRAAPVRFALEKASSRLR